MRSISIVASAFLLAINNNVSYTNATVLVCGETANYSEASSNCATNPPCPTGDGCPLEKPVCYAIPDDECFGPSEETTTIATDVTTTIATSVSSSSESPTPAPVRVCASTYDEAVANCRTNDQCENGDTTLCTDDTHACFTVSIFLCPPDESSTSPTPTPRVCGTDAMDAQSNCLDENKLCPTGGGCADGEACFNVLPNKCGVTTMTTNSPTPAVGVTTASPTMLRGGDASTQAPSPAPVLQVCGANYTDASKNLCTYPQCPTGDGCESGTACFAFPGLECNDEETEDQPTTTTIATESVEATTTQATIPTTEPPTVSTTTEPTVAPTSSAQSVGNTFFCGVDYEAAKANCATAQACPTGFGCLEQGEACFGIGAEGCASASPTNSPSEPDLTTITPAPSAGLPEPTTPSPTKAPTINTLFCGVGYEDALDNCSVGTACPAGTQEECPSGLSCFTGIQCTVTAPLPTKAPVIFWDEITATSPPVEVVVPELQKFCGVNAEDAENRCSVTSPCPDGSSNNCADGESCFPILGPCEVSDPSQMNPGAQPTTPVALSTSAPTASSSKSVVTFDPNNTMYCGDDYNDAESNCYKRTPCPNGSNEECPNLQTCFPITSCETPPPTVSVTPTNVGGLDASASPTLRPSKSPNTPQPTWNLDLGAPNPNPNAAGMLSLCFSLKSIVLGAVLFWMY